MAVSLVLPPSPDRVKISRALISVSDKTGIVEFGKFLAASGVEVISTGGTRKALVEAGVPAIEVAEITGFPEILDGRVKTLHPKVHGGLLAVRGLKDHKAALENHGLPEIDLLVVNLYPFESTVAAGADADTCIENIDIGGPAMIRAAAKNHGYVTVVTHPDQLLAIQAEMEANAGSTTLLLRRRLAGEAYARTAAYDARIANWFAVEREETLPATLPIAGTEGQSLRYGENPHQQAAFYRMPDARGNVRPGVATAEQLQGKELSYNNLNDTDAAFELAAEFDEPAVAIIKHANPCGVATAPTLEEAWMRALECDPVSAFGGVIAVNRSLDAATAEQIGKLFVEVVIAPEVSEEAKSVLASKKNLRLLKTGAMPDPASIGLAFKNLSGGLLAQTRDNGRIEVKDLKVVTKRAPTEQEMKDLLFAFRVGKHVKSNAIVYVKNGATVGVGAGQMSRVDSARIAARKAIDAAQAAGIAEALTKGSVVASDAFFPFADGLMAAVEAGATAVIQPGGSIRDDEVIAAADEAGLAMVFTGMRHFRH
ncbi:MAG: bifunctional phosphoribosylaminoimidazolecarboxamide formyltransferase/IMP cyclohydrolase [Rhodospirillales bacterium]